MVVDYRKVNSKVLFDSHPMSSIDQAFDQFSGAVIFSVFDLNSAYFRIPLTPQELPSHWFLYTLWVVRV